jgi:hypothetical protein
MGSMHCDCTTFTKSADKHDVIKGSTARSIIGRDSGFKYESTLFTIGSSDLDVIVFIRVVLVFLEKIDEKLLLAFNIPTPLLAVPVNFIFSNNAFTDSDENIMLNILFAFSVRLILTFLHTISFIF